MKSALFLAVLVFTSVSQASMVGCPTTIQMAVAAKLEELHRDHEKVGEPVLRAKKGKKAIYEVSADSQSMLPTHSKWEVETVTMSEASCAVISVKMIGDIQ